MWVIIRVWAARSWDSWSAILDLFGMGGDDRIGVLVFFLTGEMMGMDEWFILV